MYRISASVLSFCLLFMMACGTSQDAREVGVVTTDDGLVTPQPRQVSAVDRVPSGTVLNAELIDTISPETADEGDRFRARVTGDLFASDGEVLIPEGAMMTGRITGIYPAEQTGSQAAVRLDFDEIRVGNESYDLDAEIVETSVERRTRSVEGEDVGVGAAAGAALGAILGDDVGDVLLGGAIGAGAGTLVSLGTGDVEPEIPAGTVLAVETDSQLIVRA